MIDENSLKNIEKLHEMKASGILSEAEFNEAKQRLLAAPAAPSQRTRTAQTVPTGRPADDDYVAWALLPLKRYAQFTGRSGRREFWLFFLAINIVVAALAVVWMSDVDYGGTGPIGALAAITMVLGLLGVTVPYFAVQVRRLHDQGRPGLLVALNLIPYVGGFALLVLMAMEGVRGDNEFGPDPLA